MSNAVCKSSVPLSSKETSLQPCGRFWLEANCPSKSHGVRFSLCHQVVISMELCYQSRRHVCARQTATPCPSWQHQRRRRTPGRSLHGTVMQRGFKRVVTFLDSWKHGAARVHETWNVSASSPLRFAVLRWIMGTVSVLNSPSTVCMQGDQRQNQTAHQRISGEGLAMRNNRGAGGRTAKPEKGNCAQPSVAAREDRCWDTLRHRAWRINPDIIFARSCVILLDNADLPKPSHTLVARDDT